MNPPLTIFAVVNDVYGDELIERYFRYEVDAAAYAEKRAVEYADETQLEERREQIYVKRITVK